MDTIEIKKANAIAAHSAADKAGKKLIETLFGKENLFPQDITERVKTFDDAYEIFMTLKFKDDFFSKLQARDKEDLTSADRCFIICRVLNEDWKPDWNNSSEYKYYPWMEYKSGVGFSFDGYVDANADSDVGSRLCYRTSELAKYAGTQFQKEYNDYFSI